MRSEYLSREHAGFTLIEVLVSLVVLSVSLLGMAKLMLSSSHANDSAYMRSQATALAYEMIDNMHANLSQATLTGSQGYNVALGATPTAPTSCTQSGSSPPSPCTPAQQAAWDVYNWLQHLNAANQLGGGLPSGTGSVVVSSTLPATATVTVQWDDTAAQCIFGSCTAAQAGTMSISLQTVLQ